MSSEVKQMSRAVIEGYKNKLDHLKNVARLEIAQQIKEARAFGDISENAEYDAAMDLQARTEYEIQQLEEMLANVVEIDEASIDTSTVGVGTKVRIENIKNKMTAEYEIVASSVADPFTNKISNESPVGHALIGHKVDDIIDVSAPAGVAQYKIINISK